MIFTSCSSRSRPNSWRGWKRLPRWQQDLPHRRTTELGTGWNPACTLERLPFVYLIDGCTCPARPRPWVRTSRTWNKCQGFHGSPLNGRLASHGPSRCTGTSTKIKPINVDFFLCCFSILCVSHKTETFEDSSVDLPTCVQCTLKIISNFDFEIWQFAKYLLPSQCLNLCGDNLNEILEVHQICKG